MKKGKPIYTFIFCALTVAACIGLILWLREALFGGIMNAMPEMKAITILYTAGLSVISISAIVALTIIIEYPVEKALRKRLQEIDCESERVQKELDEIVLSSKLEMEKLDREYEERVNAAKETYYAALKAAKDSIFKDEKSDG